MTPVSPGTPQQGLMLRSKRVLGTPSTTTPTTAARREGAPSAAAPTDATNTTLRPPERPPPPTPIPASQQRKKQKAETESDSRPPQPKQTTGAMIVAAARGFVRKGAPAASTAVHRTAAAAANENSPEFSKSNMDGAAHVTKNHGGKGIASDKKATRRADAPVATASPAANKNVTDTTAAAGNVMTQFGLPQEPEESSFLSSGLATESETYVTTGGTLHGDAAPVPTDGKSPPVLAGAPLRSDLKAAPTTMNSGKTGSTSSSKSVGLAAGTKTAADHSTPGATPRRNTTIGTTATANNSVSGMAVKPTAGMTESGKGSKVPKTGKAATASRNVSDTAEDSTAGMTESGKGSKVPKTGKAATASRNVSDTAEDSTAGMTESGKGSKVPKTGKAATVDCNVPGFADGSPVGAKLVQSAPTDISDSGKTAGITAGVGLDTSIAADTKVKGKADGIAAGVELDKTANTDSNRSDKTDGITAGEELDSSTPADTNVKGKGDGITAGAKTVTSMPVDSDVSNKNSGNLKERSLNSATAAARVDATLQANPGPPQAGSVQGAAIGDATSGTARSLKVVNATGTGVSSPSSAANTADHNSEGVKTPVPSQKTRPVRSHDESAAAASRGPTVARRETQQASAPAPEGQATNVAPSLAQGATETVQANVGNEDANGLQANGTAQVNPGGRNDAVGNAIVLFREGRLFLEQVERSEVTRLLTAGIMFAVAFVLTTVHPQPFLEIFGGAQVLIPFTVGAAAASWIFPRTSRLLPQAVAWLGHHLGQRIVVASVAVRSFATQQRQWVMRLALALVIVAVLAVCVILLITLFFSLG